MGWSSRTRWGDVVEDVATMTPSVLPSGFVVNLPNVANLQPYLVDFPPPPGGPGPTAVLGTFRLGESTLGVNQDRRVGAFVRDAGVGPGTVGELTNFHYLPLGTTPDGRIGSFVIGRSPLGYRKSQHKRIIDVLETEVS